MHDTDRHVGWASSANVSFTAGLGKTSRTRHVASPQPALGGVARCWSCLRSHELSTPADRETYLCSTSAVTSGRSVQLAICKSGEARCTRQLVPTWLSRALAEAQHSWQRLTRKFCHGGWYPRSSVAAHTQPDALGRKASMMRSHRERN